jgi:hypothetical protein
MRFIAFTDSPSNALAMHLTIWTENRKLDRLAAGLFNDTVSTACSGRMAEQNEPQCLVPGLHSIHNRNW